MATHKTANDTVGQRCLRNLQYYWRYQASESAQFKIYEKEAKGNVRILATKCYCRKKKEMQIISIPDRRQETLDKPIGMPPYGVIPQPQEE